VSKPTDFILWFNGTPVTLSLLEHWRPGITSCGIVEALECLPEYFGQATSRVSIADIKLDFKFTPKAGETPESLRKERQVLEDQYLIAVQKYLEHDRTMSNESSYDDKVLWANLNCDVKDVEEKLIEINKKISMVSRLSE